MQTSAREAYLSTQVMTVTPQKLHLMLIEGAIRSLLQAQHYWQQQKDEEASEVLIRGQEIISELLGSVSIGEHEISRRLAALYLYLFRTTTEAHLEHNEAKLKDVLRVLEIERETWSMVCEKFGTTNESQSEPATSQKPAPQKPAPVIPPLATNSDLPSGGFSFQA